jgi:hypothetical protein
VCKLKCVNHLTTEKGRIAKKTLCKKKKETLEAPIVQTEFRHTSTHDSISACYSKAILRILQVSNVSIAKHGNGHGLPGGTSER